MIEEHENEFIEIEKTQNEEYIIITTGGIQDNRGRIEQNLETEKWGEGEGTEERMMIREYGGIGS